MMFNILWLYLSEDVVKKDYEPALNVFREVDVSILKANHLQRFGVEAGIYEEFISKN